MSKHCGHARRRVCKADWVGKVEEYARRRVCKADGVGKVEEYARRRVCKADGVAKVEEYARRRVCKADWVGKVEEYARRSQSVFGICVFFHTMHGDVSTPSCCAFTHGVALETGKEAESHTHQISIQPI